MGKTEPANANTISQAAIFQELKSIFRSKLQTGSLGYGMEDAALFLAL